MKKIIAVLCLALLAMPVLAATDQQAKACNAEAAKKALKGDKRKAFIKNCVSAKAKTKPEAGANPGAAATPETKTARPPTTPPTAAGAPSQPTAESAAIPAANVPAPNPASATGKERLRCEELARQSNVSPARKKTFMDKCMAG